jgi:hypothetical protein
MWCKNASITNNTNIIINLNDTDQHLHRLESSTTIMAAATTTTTTTGSIMEMAVASKTGSRRVWRASSPRFSPFPPFFLLYSNSSFQIYYAYIGFITENTTKHKDDNPSLATGGLKQGLRRRVSARASGFSFSFLLFFANNYLQIATHIRTQNGNGNHHTKHELLVQRASKVDFKIYCL